MRIRKLILDGCCWKEPTPDWWNPFHRKSAEFLIITIVITTYKNAPGRLTTSPKSWGSRECGVIRYSSNDRETLESTKAEETNIGS